MWQIEVAVPSQAVAPLEASLAPYASALSSRAADGGWLVQALFADAVGRDTVALSLAALARALAIAPIAFAPAPLPAADWVQLGLDRLGPVRAGRFRLRGSHDRASANPALIDLLVDAGLAFGTGHHATTRGCLRALDRLARGHRFRRVLDLGCGSGVLAMAAAKCFGGVVWATDIDPVAVAVTRANARRNRLGPRIKAITADGFEAPALSRARRYDLILANILARPLARLAPAMARALAPGGVAVLAGVLEDQQRWVLNGYLRQGFRLAWRVLEPGWPTLVLVKPGPA
jgi:ribosomal protein L11 methyltransferase